MFGGDPSVTPRTIWGLTRVEAGAEAAPRVRLEALLAGATAGTSRALTVSDGALVWAPEVARTR